VIEVNGMDLDFSIITALTVNKYFRQQYQDKPAILKMIVGGKEIIIPRPNHGLAHGIRQGFLAVDIVKILCAISPRVYSSYSPQTVQIINTLKRASNNDKFFLLKIQFAASFMRTGRRSEISSSQDMKLYCEYERQDCVNFEHHAKEYIGIMYRDIYEIRNYGASILWYNVNNTNMVTITRSNNIDPHILRQIFHTAHLCDLRRINSFNIARIQHNIMIGLGLNTKLASESRIGQQLWNQSGKYLAKSGDRDIVSQRSYQPRFMLLSKSPTELATLLHGVHTAPI
jgi:hypothetical protein